MSDFQPNDSNTLTAPGRDEIDRRAEQADSHLADVAVAEHDERTERIESARQILDYLEKNPNVPLPFALQRITPWYIHVEAGQVEFLTSILGGKQKTFGSLILEVSGPESND